MNDDAARMLSAARQLEMIKQETMAALDRASSMNQNLIETGFMGDAALVWSAQAEEDLSNVGREVCQRFQDVIDMIERSARQY